MVMYQAKGPDLHKRKRLGSKPPSLISSRWSGRQDSNLRHPAPKAGALPNCATSRNAGIYITRIIIFCKCFIKLFLNIFKRLFQLRNSSHITICQKAVNAKHLINGIIYYRNNQNDSLHETRQLKARKFTYYEYRTY